jgi:hypothetical protein
MITWHARAYKPSKAASSTAYRQTRLSREHAGALVAGSEDSQAGGEDLAVFLFGLSEVHQ